MYRHIFSFTLKLITTLLQKLAIFHIWNVKQKDDGMDQNILHCSYDEYPATNQQTQINKTCCRDFASLPCHIIFKGWSKFIICRWISLRLGKVS